MLTLYVKRLTGKTGTIEVNSNDTIKKGKSLIPDVNIVEQRWIWAGRQLDDEKTFKNYEIPDKATIHLVRRLRGGGMTFSRMDKKMEISTQKATNDTPDYLLIGPGLNIRCVCDYNNCETQKHGGNIYFRKGLGIHDLPKLEARCPECTKPVKMITPCFFRCSYRIDGILAEDKKKVYFEGRTRNNNADEYNDNKSVEWDSLIIRCFGHVTPYVKE